MAWLLVVVVIIVIGLAVMAGSGKFGQVPPIVDDRPAPDLPEGDLSAESLRSVRFAVVPRGYSMSQVDQLSSTVWLPRWRPAKDPISRIRVGPSLTPRARIRNNGRCTTAQ